MPLSTTPNPQLSADQLIGTLHGSLSLLACEFVNEIHYFQNAVHLPFAINQEAQKVGFALFESIPWVPRHQTNSAKRRKEFGSKTIMYLT